VTFEEFVAARGQALLRFAYVLTADSHLAEDVVQNALVKALRHWGRVERSAQPEAYVRRIVVTTWADHWRRSSSSEVASDVPDARTSPDPADRIGNADEMWRALAALGDRQRAVLVLRFYLDLDDEEIARQLGISRVTVRSQASRALATLRERWTPATGAVDVNNGGRP
jgi:RNA polymerase sigma-70 factor (sigma-E family)